MIALSQTIPLRENKNPFPACVLLFLPQALCYSVIHQITYFYILLCVVESVERVLCGAQASLFSLDSKPEKETLDGTLQQHAGTS